MPIRSLTFSPDSQLLITASDDNHIKMYDVYHLPSFLVILKYFIYLYFFIYLLNYFKVDLKWLNG